MLYKNNFKGSYLYAIVKKAKSIKYLQTYVGKNWLVQINLN